jgi:hypothetical protein
MGLTKEEMRQADGTTKKRRWHWSCKQDIWPNVNQGRRRMGNDEVAKSGMTVTRVSRKLDKTRGRNQKKKGRAEPKDDLPAANQAA